MTDQNKKSPNLRDEIAEVLAEDEKSAQSFEKTTEERIVQPPSAEETHSGLEEVDQVDPFSFYRVDEKVSEKIAAPEYSYWGSVFKKFFSSKVAITMLIILALILLMSFIQPMISGFSNMDATNINDKSQWFLPPSSEHLFGTNDKGIDLFNQVWAGARTSLSIAIIATLIVTFIGLVVGTWWGFSKRVDMVMIEVYNIVSNIPFILIVMVLSYALGAGVPQLIFAMTVTTWVGEAYFYRVQVMIIRDREYNLASRTLGSSKPKMIIHNVLPYLVSVIVTSISRSIPAFISTEVYLSFLGTGLSEESASLGRIVQKNVSYMTSAPHLFLIPLGLTALISITTYLVGQTLADAADPRNHML